MARSWVWSYADRKGDYAFCKLCDPPANNNRYYCAGGSTGAIGNHLRGIHNILPESRERRSEKRRLETRVEGETEVDDPGVPVPATSSQNIQIDESNTSSSSYQSDWSTSSSGVGQNAPSPKRRRTRPNRSQQRNRNDVEELTTEKTEALHQAVAKMVAVDQLPLSFVSNKGFNGFLNKAVPGYKVCKEKALKTRLKSLRNKVTEKIRQDLRSSSSVACTSDCWTSRANDSYITVESHSINDKWERKSFTLSTKAVEGRHTSANLHNVLEGVFLDWEIDGKVSGVVTDNAQNMLNAVVSPMVSEHEGLTCAAHTLQLAAKAGLQYPEAEIIVSKASKLVGHFKHSTLATKSLEEEQILRSMKVQPLVQSEPTRWDSTYYMLERLLSNRTSVSSVMSHRAITSANVARKLEILEAEWERMKELVAILKPLQVATTVLCGTSSPTSMVRPLMQKIVKTHLNPEEDETTFSQNVKLIITDEIERRFKLSVGVDRFKEVSSRLTASFVDPRYKDLQDETSEIAEKVREHVLELLQTREGTPSEQNNQQSQREHETALEFLFHKPTHSSSSVEAQLANYLAEPELSITLDSLEWWKARETKYPALAVLARKWLAMPATSAGAERTFSTAGNIVTSKRNCLAPENVDMLVFLYQNREYID